MATAAFWRLNAECWEWVLDGVNIFFRSNGPITQRAIVPMLIGIVTGLIAGLAGSSKRGQVAALLVTAYFMTMYIVWVLQDWGLDPTAPIGSQPSGGGLESTPLGLAALGLALATVALAVLFVLWREARRLVMVIVIQLALLWVTFLAEWFLTDWVATAEAAGLTLLVSFIWTLAYIVKVVRKGG